MIVRIKKSEIDGEVWMCAAMGMLCLLIQYGADALVASGALKEAIGNGLAGHIADACFGAFLLAMRQHLGLATDGVAPAQPKPEEPAQ